MSRTPSPSPRFDFDHWAELARRDPAVFEELRRLTLDLAILKRSRERRARLRGLQWRIDRLREQAPNPLAACVKISGLMWDNFERLQAGWNDPATLRRGPAAGGRRLPPRGD